MMDIQTKWQIVDGDGPRHDANLESSSVVVVVVAAVAGLSSIMTTCHTCNYDYYCNHPLAIDSFQWTVPIFLARNELMIPIVDALPNTCTCTCRAVMMGHDGVMCCQVLPVTVAPLAEVSNQDGEGGSRDDVRDVRDGQACWIVVVVCVVCNVPNRARPCSTLLLLYL